MMQYLAYTVMAILSLTVVATLAMSCYVGYKYSHGFLPTQKSSKMSLKYGLLSASSFGLLVFIFFWFIDGFSWEILLPSLLVTVMVSIPMLFGCLSNTLVINFFNKRELSLEKLLKQIENLYQNTSGKKHNKDKK
ncbi:MAG: hypothetical protein L6461_19830 [Anaerolineae bacterium]|nr:hypothetical protein [Anaerolineae bacterium]